MKIGGKFRGTANLSTRVRKTGMKTPMQRMTSNTDEESLNTALISTNRLLVAAVRPAWRFVNENDEKRSC